MAPPILVGLGANLDSPRWGAPRETLAAALAALASEGVAILARSGWYRSAPVPLSDQPWFVNAAASVATRLAAPDLLALMQAVEHRFGRTRGERFASPDLVLPHPRLHQRRFVLEPLAEIAPEWRHPTLGSTARQLIAALADAQPVERFAC